MARLILDRSVVIAGARRQFDVDAPAEDGDIAVPAIVNAEDLAGVELDGNPGRGAAKRAFLDDVLDEVPIHDHDDRVAREHASLLAYVRRTGRPRGAHDLIIAATARATVRIVATADESAHFGDLPDVHVRLITW